MSFSVQTQTVKNFNLVIVVNLNLVMELSWLMYRCLVCNHSCADEGETLAIDGERDLDGTDGTVQRGDDEPVFLPEEPVPPELIPSVLETQQGGDTQEVGDSSPPLDATASTPCITEASCTGEEFGWVTCLWAGCRMHYIPEYIIDQ